MFSRDVSRLVLEFLDEQKAQRHREAIHKTFDSVEELEEMIRIFQVSENTLDELTLPAFFYAASSGRLTLAKVLRERYQIPDDIIMDVARDSYLDDLDEIGDYLVSFLPRSSFDSRTLIRNINRYDTFVPLVMMVALADKKSLRKIGFVAIKSILLEGDHQTIRLLIRRGVFERDVRIPTLFNIAYLKEDLKMQKILKPLMLKYMASLPS